MHLIFIYVLLLWYRESAYIIDRFSKSVERVIHIRIYVVYDKKTKKCREILQIDLYNAFVCINAPKHRQLLNRKNDQVHLLYVQACLS